MSHERHDLSEVADDPVKAKEPKAESCHVTGTISSPFSLTLAGESIGYGKWTYGPMGSVPAGSGQLAFEARGRAHTATGVDGHADYKFEDGATFRLYFDDPYSKANQASITGIAGPVTRYTFKVEFPGSGSDWVAAYTIQKK